MKKIHSIIAILTLLSAAAILIAVPASRAHASTPSRPLIDTCD